VGSSTDGVKLKTIKYSLKNKLRKKQVVNKNGECPRSYKNRTHSLKNKLRKKQTATSEIYDEMMYNFIQYFRNNYRMGSMFVEPWKFPILIDNMLLA
jgi:hypothetical protein